MFTVANNIQCYNELGTHKMGIKDSLPFDSTVC